MNIYVEKKYFTKRKTNWSFIKHLFYSTYKNPRKFVCQIGDNTNKNKKGIYS